MFSSVGGGCAGQHCWDFIPVAALGGILDSAPGHPFPYCRIWPCTWCWIQTTQSGAILWKGGQVQGQEVAEVAPTPASLPAPVPRLPAWDQETRKFLQLSQLFKLNSVVYFKVTLPDLKQVFFFLLI